MRPGIKISRVIVALCTYRIDDVLYQLRPLAVGKHTNFRILRFFVPLFRSLMLTPMPLKRLLFSFRLKFLYFRLKHTVLFGLVLPHLCTPSTFTYFSYLSISVFIFPTFVIQPFPSSKTCRWFPMWHATKYLVCQQHYIPSGEINTSLSPVLHRIRQCYWKCQLGVGHKIWSVKSIAS